MAGRGQRVRPDVAVARRGNLGPRGDGGGARAAHDDSARAVDACDGLLEPPGFAGTSSEFDRLMQDSMDSGCNSPLPGGATSAAGSSSSAIGALIVRSPRVISDSPTRPLHGSPAVSSSALPAQTASSLPVMPQGMPVASSPASWEEPSQAQSVRSESAAAPPTPAVSAPATLGSVCWAAPGSQDPWALQQLSCRLDDITREMKRSVEHEFMLAERALCGRHEALQEAQRAKAEEAAFRQQQVIEALTADKQQLSRRLDTQQRQLKGSLALLQRARRGIVGRCSVARAFTSWRAAAASAKDDRHQQLLANKIHHRNHIGFTFGAWRRIAQASSKDRIVAHERAIADTVRAKIFEQMEAERSGMSAEVERLKALLAEEGKQRAMLQENLKRVFMRGVCALNFEAMSLLSDGGGAGANPMMESVEQLLAGAAPMGMQRPTPDETATPVTSAASAPPQGTETDRCEAAQAAHPHTPVGANASVAASAQHRVQADAEVAAPAAPFAPSDASPPLPAPASPGVASEQESARQAPTPLPFVSYTGPLESSTMAAVARGASTRASAGGGPCHRGNALTSATPKGFRWQQAPPTAVR